MYLNSKLVNTAIAEASPSWYYAPFAADDKTLAQAERQAGEVKIGVWADTQFVAPWDWRKLSNDERDELR